MRKWTSHNPHLSRWSWFLFLAFLACTPCGAQDLILHLRNGDRLTGRFVSESTNSVVISTAFSEHLSVPLALIQSRETITNAVGTTSPPSTKKPAALPGQRPPAPATGVASELVLTNKPSLAQTAGGAAKSPEQPTKAPEPSKFRKFLSEWRGEAQLGANLGFGAKDREAFTGHIKLTHNHAFANEHPLRNILDYDVAYGTTDSVLSDNRMEGNWKLEYDLNKRVLLYNASSAGYDEIRGIDLQYDFGPGVGYKWLVLTNFVLKTELGADYQEQSFVHDKHSNRYSLRLAQDMWWQFTPKIRWDEKAEFFPEIRDFGEYRIRLETNLSYLLKENLTLTLNVVDLYDTALPPGVSKNDVQIRSLLGIKF